MSGDDTVDATDRQVNGMGRSGFEDETAFQLLADSGEFLLLPFGFRHEGEVLGGRRKSKPDLLSAQVAGIGHPLNLVYVSHRIRQKWRPILSHTDMNVGHTKLRRQEEL